MRIAFLDSWLQDVAEGSGTAAAIGGLAAALAARGHQVERLVPQGAWPRHLLLRRLWFNLTLPRRLAAAQGRYDLLVGFDIDGFRVAHRCSVPYVCCIKGVLAEESRCESGWPRLMLWGLSQLERLNARRAPRVLSTSRYCCERIEAHYGVPADRLRLVPEGIDTGLWNPAGANVAALAALDGAREPHTVLCVARQYPRKRVGDLITAFQSVHARLPSARLVVIGDGPEHGALVELAQRLGLASVVQLLGALPDDGAVREWYRRSAVFCLPSIQEGFGIVFLEAMASGLPVVSTTATAIPEVVPQGRAGLLVPPRDPAALAEALVKLLTDEALQARCRAYGREHVEPFSWDRVAERFLAAVSPQAAAGS
ncbi:MULTISPECIES: glycosyltransferase family 4 protein [unclassified Cyanobium]|uniref:glycosyltransferase family 4 protein n=1 Tax=unclassified Cyanobium TaxID=2627006 RepID=UPI0020CF3AC7|nr:MULTISPECIES: glycosyltransferase family 4 protein [unclassified Cyanobium]MCP9857874.1 glycosyltransferase family 4 protein [Cyanobium sp. Cruz-8H5]MCP9865069.1 glycosyltransferase family 4 protein [Cyanobium sp. Cruz-8D1]